MKGSGPKDERETVIVWDESGKDASLWTASDTVYNGMLKRGWTPKEDDERHAVFIVPKSRMRLPRQKSNRGFQNKQKDWAHPTGEVVTLLP